MSEKELNEKYIRNKISGICQDCIYLDKIVPIINEMLSEQYIEGLKQGHFDNQINLIILEHKINKAIAQCESVIGNPEYAIVSKNELMKIMLEILKGEPNDE